MPAFLFLLLVSFGACQPAAPARPLHHSPSSSLPPSMGSPASPIHGQLKQVDGLDVLFLWGTRDEIGYAEGALLCGRISRFFTAYYLDFLVPMLDTSYAELSSKLLPRYDIPEGDERELRGILRGMHERCPASDLLVKSTHLEPAANRQRELRYEDLVFSSLAYELFLGCSSFTVWGKASASGATLHARNVDFLMDPTGVYGSEHILKVYSDAEQGNARWASLSWPGSLVCQACFTQDGLGMTVNGTNILPVPKEATGKIPLTSAHRAALVRSIGTQSQLEGLAERLKESPVRTGSNLSVFWPCRGSACRGGAVIEQDGDTSHPDGRVTLRHPGEASNLRDATVATNYYLKRVSKPPENPEAIAHYQTLTSAIEQSTAQGGVDAKMAHALMNAVAARGQVLTVITVILDTATQQLSVYRSTQAGKPATETKPSTVNLAEQFSGFPPTVPARPAILDQHPTQLQALENGP